MSKNRSHPPTPKPAPPVKSRPDMAHVALAAIAAMALGFSVGNIGNEAERVAPIVEIVEVETSSTSIERVPVDEQRAGAIVGRVMSEAFDR